nr:hypothetical protein [Tanacetum cinerariifolium]
MERHYVVLSDSDM